MIEKSLIKYCVHWFLVKLKDQSKIIVIYKLPVTITQKFYEQLVSHYFCLMFIHWLEMTIGMNDGSGMLKVCHDNGLVADAHCRTDLYIYINDWGWKNASFLSKDLLAADIVKGNPTILNKFFLISSTF